MYIKNAERVVTARIQWRTGVGEGFNWVASSSNYAATRTGS